MIAQTVALDHPGRVASLALVNTTSEYSDDQLQAWRDRAALVLRDGMAAVREPLMARWLTAARPRPAVRAMFIWMRRSGGLRRQASTLPAPRCAASIPLQGLEIEVPSIVIATPDDPGVPTETSRKMAETLGAPLHWLEPAQHLASLEHVERFNGLMRDFLADAASP